MVNKVEISQPVRDLLATLKLDDPVAAKELRLVLLSLARNPQPRGSRELKPKLVGVVPGERIWSRPHWVITYQFDEPNQVIKVGVVERR